MAEKIIQKSDYSKRHYCCLSVVGGFLEAYTLMNRGGLFANAQTANYTHIWISLAEGHFADFLYYIFPMLLYCAAIFIATLMPLWLKRFSWAKICLLIEMATIVLLGLLPSNVDYKYAILPIFFCTALQYQTFQSCYGFSASTIFVTNNIRQFTNAFALFLTKKDKYQLFKSKIYLHTILCFALGVVIAVALGALVGDASVFVCIIPLLIVFIMISI